MGFEWDENKRRINIEDHELDFLDVVQIFDGRRTYTYYSPRRGEDRWATVGEVEGRLLVVAWTWRGNNRRIISAYRADTSDERAYRALYG